MIPATQEDLLFCQSIGVIVSSFAAGLVTRASGFSVCKRFLQSALPRLGIVCVENSGGQLGFLSKLKGHRWPWAALGWVPPLCGGWCPPFSSSILPYDWTKGGGHLLY